MKSRCNNPNASGYHRYGGRGIKVYPEQNDYTAFEKQALNNGYNENASRGECTIDRINVDGDYEPNNCRQVNQQAQMNNVSYNHHLTYNGETHTIAEQERILNIKTGTIRNRIRQNVSNDKQFTTKDLRYK